MIPGKKSRIIGLTLIELMVVTMIIGIIMLGVQTFFGNGLRFFKIQQSKMETQRDARRCLSLLNRKLRESKSTTIIVSRIDSTQPPCSSIYFQTVKDEQFRFFQSGTKLYMADLNRGATQQIAENLRHITYCYPMLSNDKIISISICFEKYSKSPDVKSLQLSVEKVRIMND
ncbi:MAG: hypothetical protein A2252_10615 [Elusimicrobia bacterium RIFOXYA2_FULL_39_19]|nr:MAG: hypothetical protein A2252_10615 [Elusimicrobia bacterium RIFOXYA2_FULL_39_19]